MTNHWNDIKNSDCIMIIGSNAAENHVCTFRWVMEAMEKGAKLISVDPRFTRTSSKANIYAPIRPGTDIAFIGGLIKYVLDNNLYHKEYVVEYTNAAFLINPKFDFKDGLFSGFDKKKRAYADKSSWQYQLDANGIPKQDKTLQDPNSVFQLLKRHFSRYDVDTVCKITGTPKDVYLKVAETYCATGAPDKAGTILYAMGATQHTHGTQNIRAYAILQMLLGNMGMAGGGINALRGESNVQGSTDHALLFHILPGYLKAPRAEDKSLADYVGRYTPVSKDPKSANWLQNTPKYIVSLLKAFWGKKAHKGNDFCYDYLPKVSADYSWISLFEAMNQGTIKGLLCFGQNPAVCGPNLGLELKALEKLDWLVVVDIFETETASFWKAPGVYSGSLSTEVFLLPAASHVEKEGSITNSGRWSQWRYKGAEPPGEAKTDLWIIDKIYRGVKVLYEKEGGKYPGPIIDLSWGYGDEPEPDVHRVAKEINGFSLETGKQLASFAELKDDGSTACGNWIYCGSYTEKGNMAARRSLVDVPNNIGLYPEWAWSWPLNRRILYNRASCDPKGRPWNPEKYVIKWTGEKWIGDVPDGGWPPEAKYPFIMVPEGHARIFGMGLADGPFPEHYEPMESPMKNLLSSQQYTPTVHIYESARGKFGDADNFPIIATTYRVSEHWQAGAMTRNLPWLIELMPDMFVEMSKSLAEKKGIRNGEKVKVVSARGEIEAVAIVTDRIKPFNLNGRVVEQIGLPWHWGFTGISIGDSANLLTSHVGDVNTRIPEYKAFLCDVRKVG